MKQPPYTAPPLMNAGPEKFSLRRLLLGHASSTSAAYYEAHRDDNGVYILWMEFSRFGKLYAYPCVLQEREQAPLVFRSGGGAENDALLARWNDLITPESFCGFRSDPLKREDFQRIYNAYKDGKA